MFFEIYVKFIILGKNFHFEKGKGNFAILKIFLKIRCDENFGKYLEICICMGFEGGAPIAREDIINLVENSIETWKFDNFHGNFAIF